MINNEKLSNSVTNSLYLTNNQEEQELKSLIEEIEIRINQTEFELHNGDLVIRDHYKNIKHMVNLAKEARLNELNTIFDNLLNKLNEHETESFAGYLKNNKQEFEDKLNELKLFLVEFKKLNQSKQNIKKDLDNLKEIKSKLMIEQHKLKRFNFNDQLIEYRDNKCKLSSNILGRLAAYPFETVKFDQFEKIDYGKYLNALLREEYHNYPSEIEELRHIDIEGTGFMENGDFIVLSIYYDHCDDSINHLNIFQFDESRELKNLKRIEDVNLDETIFKIVGNNLCINYKDDLDNKYYIKILDENLQTRVTIVIENKTLVGADKQFIYCLSDDEKDLFPLHIYNWSLELIEKIGQRTNSEKEFFFPKYCNQVLTITGNDRKYYVVVISDYINIIDAVSGELVKSIEQCAQKIELDSKNNIVCFSRRCFTYLNSNGYLIKELHLIDFPKTTIAYWSLNHDDKLYYFDPERFYLAN